MKEECLNLGNCNKYETEQQLYIREFEEKLNKLEKYLDEKNETRYLRNMNEISGIGGYEWMDELTKPKFELSRTLSGWIKPFHIKFNNDLEEDDVKDSEEEEVGTIAPPVSIDTTALGFLLDFDDDDEVRQI